MSSPGQVDAQGITVPTGNVPSCGIGRKALHVRIDFSLGDTYTLDLTAVQNSGQFDAVQTLYIDNSQSSTQLDIVTGVTLQTVSIPAGGQAYIPMLQPNPPLFQFNPHGGSAIIHIFCLNFFVPPAVWYVNGTPIMDLTLESVISNGAVNTTTKPLTVTGSVDASATIATGGTRQVLFAANSARKRFTICNPSSATEVLQFSYVLNTAGLIDIPPGTTWNEADFSVSGEEIWIVAATTAHAFTAYSW